MAVPGGQGNVYRVSEGVFGCLGEDRWYKGALIGILEVFPLAYH